MTLQTPPAESSASTGRLAGTLLPEAQRIAQQPGVDAALGGDLRLAVDVDRAHLVMLFEQRIVPQSAALALLAEIDELQQLDFAPLRHRPAPRGWYLMYEGYLAERLGPTVAGWLPTGRSRNDLSATLALLKLREVFRTLITATLRLQLTLLRRAGAELTTVLPGFTHGQPALPITLGHYLAGVAHGVDADLERLAGLLPELDRCPLGAGAMGGTTLPIDPDRTASLLGFTGNCPNSLAAVASRDGIARLLADAAVLSTRLSRVATDLRDWTGCTPPLLHLPDSLVGSSSMMPQKRNVYLLEHIQGMAAAPVGAFTTVTSGAQKTAFSNSIAVHTEGPAFADQAIRRCADAATLLRLLIQHAEPDPGAMRRRAEDGFTNATELANRLALADGRGFRAAHQEVGRAARAALERGHGLLAEVQLPAGLTADDFDVARIADASRYGGGPAPAEVAGSLHVLQHRLGPVLTRVREATGRWSGTSARIRTAVGQTRLAIGNNTTEGSR
ncbi:lyase family protein [Microlunatus soli]|uniref:argininosuccinate lyase n=1 Tax=Microlunatus soli TaxID=630515 RepID=A0A1H1VWZ2_9ACTN|nr:lyase family protein [Microlunatus soli]SDS88579.1 argininosuccinate lyase [Microlunatus soli]